MEIRKSTPADLARILEIYADARKRMRESGNPTQWGDSWPPADMIRQDCEPNGEGYVLTDGDRICGVFAFFVGEEETYRVIEDGAWLNDQPYGVIHRVASDGTTHGILRAAVTWCSQFADNLRMDTHADNHPMQAALLANGFRRCGVIRVFPNNARNDISSARIAFQKVI